MRLLTPALCLLAALLACSTLFPPRPETTWNHSPDARVFSADTCCGMLYDPNGIPDAQLWGDGRLIWIEYTGSQRRVLSASLTEAEMTSLLQSVVDAGFFGWKDYYSPGEPIYDAPSTCMRVTLDSESKSVCETLDGAPRKFATLYQHLTAGAGKQGVDFVPTTGHLQATITESTGPAPAWPVEQAGLSLKDAAGGLTVEGEALRAAWEIVNAAPLSAAATEGDLSYSLVLLIPGLTRGEPPP